MGKRRATGRDVCGVVLLDKPQGLTSNQALQRVKRLYGAAKAGHTGSLDPLATGMLPICFGAATRVSGYLLDAAKTYAVTAALGAATATGDADGEVVGRRAVPGLEAAQLRSVLGSFRGEIEQVPPMYSALKRDGVRLYDLARRGLEVERAPRRVRIHSIELGAVRGPDFEFTVSCSKGTYVRSLVVDIAAALGTLGHVKALRRLAVGPFASQAMYDLESLERTAAERGAEGLDGLLLPVDSALADRPRLALRHAAAQALLAGQRLPPEPAWPRGLVRLYVEERAFIGVGEVSEAGELVPRRLFRA